MRRYDREIPNRSEMETLLNDTTVCRLGCDDNGKPYIVPLSFVYREGVIYIHSVHEGRKITHFKRNPERCIEGDECIGVLSDKKTLQLGNALPERHLHGKSALHYRS